MEGRKRAWVRTVALSAGLVIGLWQGVAFAGPGAPDLSGEAPSAPSAPSEDAEQSAPSAPSAPAQSAPSGTSGSSSSSAPAAPQGQLAPPPTEDDDLPGHETEDPREQRHAQADISELRLAGEELVVIGRSNAELNNANDDPSADATVLSVGGNEIIGAHSSGPDSSDSVGPLLLCEESGGQVCLSLLYANTETDEDDQLSFAFADQALAFACVGGDQPQPEENCNGLVGAGVSQSTAAYGKDKRTGESVAASRSQLADVCIGPEGEDPITGLCSGIGITLIESESSSSISDDNDNGTTEDDQGQTSRSSSVAVIVVEGEPAVEITDPTAISLPPDCPAQALVCLFLNMGESFTGTGFGGSRQEAVHITLVQAVGQIPGDSLIQGHLGVAESWVIGQPGECPPGTGGPDCEPCPPGTVGVPPDCEPEPPCPEDEFLVDGVCRPCPDPPCGGGGDNGRNGDLIGRGALAVTGANVLAAVAGAMILGTGGLGTLAWDRRRRFRR
jgi:hypothetical protein